MKTGLFKFKYGEEIVTEYEDRGDHYYISNAGGIMQTEENGFHLFVWIPYSSVKKGFLLPKSEVWFIAPLHPEMEMYFAKWKNALEMDVELPSKEKNKN
jgi:hypothetical protein